MDPCLEYCKNGSWLEDMDVEKEPVSELAPAEEVLLDQGRLLEACWSTDPLEVEDPCLEEDMPEELTPSPDDNPKCGVP